jgi:hypothetical protein
MAEDSDRYLSLLAEEYRSLQNEVADASRHCYTAIQWGTALSAVLIAAAATQWRKHDSIVVLVFLLVVPFLVSLTLFYWIGELARIRACANFLCVLEEKAAMVVDTGEWLNRLSREEWPERQGRLRRLGVELSTDVPVDPMSWERWLYSQRRMRAARGIGTGNQEWIYRSRFLLFPFAGVASLVIGSYYVYLGKVEVAETGAATVALVFGASIFLSALWAACEIGADLAWSSGAASPLWRPGPIRNAFRAGIGALLRIRWYEEREQGETAE